VKKSQVFTTLVLLVSHLINKHFSIAAKTGKKNITVLGKSAMRTNIEIDDDLMDKVLAITGLRTKREAVDQGLRALLLLKQQEQIRAFRGQFATGLTRPEHACLSLTQESVL
jgi:Arc/MetJ family transcription regulator